MVNATVVRAVAGSMIWLAAGAAAQNALPSTSAPPPVSYSSVNQLNSVLSRVEEAAKITVADLGKLKIDKWKVDSGHRRQMQSDAQSIQRNLQSALPEIMNQLRASPEDLS